MLGLQVVYKKHSALSRDRTPQKWALPKGSHIQRHRPWIRSLPVGAVLRADRGAGNWFGFGSLAAIVCCKTRSNINILWTDSLKIAARVECRSEVWSQFWLHSDLSTPALMGISWTKASRSCSNRSFRRLSSNSFSFLAFSSASFLFFSSNFLRSFSWSALRDCAKASSCCLRSIWFIFLSCRSSRGGSQTGFVIFDTKLQFS